MKPEVKVRTKIYPTISGLQHVVEMTNEIDALGAFRHRHHAERFATWLNEYEDRR